VILNGPDLGFSQLLTANRRSFLNVILAYFLYQEGAFAYVGGRSKLNPKESACEVEGYGRGLLLKI
jgi:hypothetical protein